VASKYIVIMIKKKIGVFFNVELIISPRMIWSLIKGDMNEKF